ncbi:MAG: 50S ribosomal protein L29 [Candidatus Pacebacteria bacterium]|nr:50S ribosomal protein L29 [Candidatus Paceibacterota bacterium]
MKKTDFTKKTPSEMQALIAEYRKDLLDARFSFAGAKSKGVHEQKQKRKDVARMLTLLGQTNTN